jgi:hypothetical protein
MHEHQQWSMEKSPGYFLLLLHTLSGYTPFIGNMTYFQD